MAYGAQAKRVPARGGGGISDVDIFKVGIIGKAVRGIDQIQRDIFDMNDFKAKQGPFSKSYYMAYVINSLYEELNSDISVEIISRSHVASDAVQAVNIIYDNAGAPVKIFDIKAGYRNAADKSAFGNDIAYKIENSENRTYALTADVIATATSSILNSIEGLEVGNILRYVDGATTEGVIITAINTATKTITHAALSNGYAAATSVLTRLDWTLRVAVKDANGVYQEKEVYSEIAFSKSDTIGMPSLTNSTSDGSEYVILAVNAANATTALLQRPAPVTDWTALASGADGTASVAADYTALQSELVDSGCFFMLAPELSSITHNENFAQYATDGNGRWFYYGQAANGATEATLKTFGQELRRTIRFAMIPSDKWITVNDQFGSTMAIPKVGFDVAHWYNVYNVNDEEKVAAGNAWPLKTASVLDESNGLIHDDEASSGQRIIENYSINICRFQKGLGITNNSARTLSTEKGYQYQNQIIMFLFYKRSILAYLRTIEQNKSGIRAQQQHRNAVWAYLKRKYDSGIFFRGQLPNGKNTEFSDVVTIINDFSNNTLADIANGIETTFLQFIATPPIEKPVLELASASVTTITA